MHYAGIYAHNTHTHTNTARPSVSNGHNTSLQHTEQMLCKDKNSMTQQRTPQARSQTGQLITMYVFIRTQGRSSMQARHSAAHIHGHTLVLTYLAATLQGGKLYQVHVQGIVVG